MNMPILTEPAVLAMMRQEHARASARERELWERLETATEALRPQQEALDALRAEWSKANRLTESLAACLAAKEPKVAEVAA